MELMLTHVTTGIMHAFMPMNILVMIIGLAVGTIGGMLPGITVVTSIALCIPFTFSMPAETALIALGAIYCGASYGGANAAILINTPGQPGSIATTFDGYPMTLKGEAEKALYAALLASAYGGIIGALLLLLFFQPLASLALKFGSEAFFWMAIFGLTTLAAMSPGHMMKSLFGGLLGLGISTVGLDPSDGFPRFTFGVYSLTQGLDMVVLMTSLFSFSQMLVLLESRDEYIASFAKQRGAFMAVVRELFGRCKLLMTVSSVLGTFIGGLPGAGGSVAAIITYNEAKRWDKHPEQYGTGIIKGVAVPESANNACVGGSLVPLMALGIPGSASAAVLMGGLLAQGLTPGPQLLENNAVVAYTFIASLIIVNFYMVAVGFGLAKVCAKILDVPKRYIIPSVITLSMLGAFSLRNSLFDVFILLLSGGAAYLCLKAKIQPSCIALGVVLGPIIEEALVTTLMRARSEDSVLDLLVFRPLPMLFIVLSIASLVLPYFMHRRQTAQNGKGTPARTPMRLHAANALRYNFGTVATLTLISLFFLQQSFLLEDNAAIFPLAVFGCLSALGVMICMSLLCKPATTPEPAQWRNYLIIGLYFALSVACFALITVLGFYTSMFVCLLSMLGFATFCMQKEPFTTRVAGKLLGLSLVIIAVQYACFSWLLHVPTPVGLFI